MASNGENWNDLWNEAEPLNASAQNSSVEFDLSAALDFLYPIFTTFWVIFAVLSVIFFIILQIVKHKLKLQRQKEAEFFKSQKPGAVTETLLTNNESNDTNKKDM